ncbi:MAG: Rrf2 family transcriptional regulator [bacterium]|nr:Rrf2 family transcriptional regulator [bacterium]
MIFSNISKLAIKAVAYLASQHASDVKASLLDISTAIDANTHTLGKVLQTLVKAGIIRSTKGPLGGFSLSSDQMNLSIIKIVEAVEENFSISSCVLGFKKCSHKNPCSVHHDYLAAKKVIDAMLFTKTIGSLKEPVKSIHLN